jgi:CRISPR-associated protein Cas2
MKYPPSNAKRLSAYRLMWIMVFFDLPTGTDTERKAAHQFRQNLLEEGFIMFQFSIYVRPCPSRENAETHVRRIAQILPPAGKVGILTITDKQFAMMQIFYGRRTAPKPEGYQQLMLFSD